MMSEILRILMCLTSLAFLTITAMFAADKKPQVDLLLVLASDVSLSVDKERFALQREGYAAAITDPLVLSAITSGRHRRIAISYIEWAGDGQQSVVLNWMIIHDKESAQTAADQLLKVPRSFQGWTAIGQAILSAVVHLENAPYEAERWTIDISGDGTCNRGSDVTIARDSAVSKGITINALAVLSATPYPGNPEHTHPSGGLAKYFEENVIGGPGSFVYAVEGYESFAPAIRRKMIVEIALLGSL